MLKPVIAATAALAIAGSSLVYAQQRFGGRGGFGDGGPRAEQRHRLSAEDIAAFADARIAALKAGLELTPDQTRNWPAFEQALRDMVQLRAQRAQARQAANQQTQAPTTPFDRLARRADNMSKTSAALKRIADTGAPLYQSLTDAQKGRFMALARMLRPHRMQFGMGGRDGRGFGRDGRGFGQDGRGYGRDGRGFGQDGPGFGYRRFGEDGRGPGGPRGRMQNLMSPDSDQDSQL